MKSRDFVYWLQGYLELSPKHIGLVPDQVDLIRRHLNLVFVHEIDPSFSDDPKVQAHLQEVHDGPKEAVQPVGEPYADAPPIGGGLTGQQTYFPFGGDDLPGPNGSIVYRC